MSLPATVRVRLSSEAAEGISITRVVVQEIPLRDLIEQMLGITGKDAPRIRDLLRRGALVSGASRFRWSGWEAEIEAIAEVLSTFPDPEPARPFDAARCVRAVFQGGRTVIEMPREAGAAKGMFQRRSFWQDLMDMIAEPQYGGYSYRDRADYYHAALAPPAADRLRAAAAHVKYSSLRDRIRNVAFTSVDLFVERG